jgi:hypothetical protein
MGEIKDVTLKLALSAQQHFLPPVQNNATDWIFISWHVKMEMLLQAMDVMGVLSNYLGSATKVIL